VRGSLYTDQPDSTYGQNINVQHINCSIVYTSVVDPHHFDAVPDADLDSTYHPDADPDSDFFFLCGSGCRSGSTTLLYTSTKTG